MMAVWRAAHECDRVNEGITRNSALPRIEHRPRRPTRKRNSRLRNYRYFHLILAHTPRVDGCAAMMQARWQHLRIATPHLRRVRVATQPPRCSRAAAASLHRSWARAARRCHLSRHLLRCLLHSRTASPQGVSGLIVVKLSDPNTYTIAIFTHVVYTCGLDDC